MESEFASVDHLSNEAIASFVDHELPQVAVERAYRHLERCSECRAEVRKQLKAAYALRAWHPDVHISEDLVTKLCSLSSSTCPVEKQDPGFRDFLDGFARRRAHKR